MPPFLRRKTDPAPFPTQPVSTNYAGRLAFIGRRLDEEACRSAVILEMSGSFIVRVIGKINDESTVTEVVAEDFERGDVRRPFKPQPSSYESMLRAIGAGLDTRVAANIAILEGSSMFQVTGWERGHSAGSLTHVRFDQSYDRPTLYRLAEAAR
jgi:hypothetical protein